MQLCSYAALPRATVILGLRSKYLKWHVVTKGLVALTQMSWNRIIPWLQELDLLRQSGWFVIAQRSSSRTEARCRGPDSGRKRV
jgi:hypothetical protein